MDLGSPNTSIFTRTKNVAVSCQLSATSLVVLQLCNQGLGCCNAERVASIIICVPPLFLPHFVLYLINLVWSSTDTFTRWRHESQIHFFIATAVLRFSSTYRMRRVVAALSVLFVSSLRRARDRSNAPVSSRVCSTLHGKRASASEIMKREAELGLISDGYRYVSISRIETYETRLRRI